MIIDKNMEGGLDRFFEALQPAAAVQLIHKIEIARQQGKNDPSFDAIIKHARTVLRDTEGHTEHQSPACRKFCEPFENMLVDANSCEKQIGRISRGSISPVWNWLNQELLPDELSQLESDEVSADFYRKTSQALSRAIMAVDNMDTERERRRLVTRLGGPDVFADAKEMAVVLSVAGAISKLKSKLPESIAEFDGEILKEVVKLYQNFLKKVPDNPEIFISIILKRLKRKGQVLRIAKSIICKDDDLLISASPHGIAGEMMLYDMEVIAENLARNINAHDQAGMVLFMLRQFHILASGLTSEVRINMKGQWGLRLVKVRKRVTELLEREILSVPRLIRMAVSGSNRIGKKRVEPGSVNRLNPLNCIEAERALNILVGARFLSDQISLNVTITKFFNEIKLYLEAVTEKNISLIRVEKGAARDHAIKSLEVTMKLVRVIQGDDMAELIIRRGLIAQANMEPDEALAS